ncbi:molybdenum cofactor guanylyltransferase [Candidatus Solirubrobacter pratensis]|uniref:molybdenum cofactor guanylyltransferase n=1 Tax=Candidatus Solirubrobacter pratensis TaxID=1298857 RepID=UPI0003F6F9D4|nr:molybdenum cofactor guanylyltransferase [Candidatus Solirubrobacter pratensis]
MIAAILAGGRSRRMGTDKALVPFGDGPLIARPIAAARAAGLEPVVVAKRELDVGVPVWLDRYDTSHPLAGLVTALEHGPVVAVACDQPFVTPELLAALAAHDGFAIAKGEPFPGRYEPSEILVQALREEAPMRATLAKLHAVELDVEPRLVTSLNTPEEVARWTSR